VESPGLASGSGLEAPGRYLLHTAILLVAMAAAALGEARAQASRTAALGGSTAASVWQIQPDLTASTQQFLRAPSLPTEPTPTDTTAAPPSRDAITTYRVLPGENPTDIAIRFGVTVDTILQANDLKDGDLIQVGQELVILPVSGALHKVVRGDTLAGIAKTYGVEVNDIVGYGGNELTDASSLPIGKLLVVPGGEAPVVVVRAAPATAAPAPVVAAAPTPRAGAPAPTPAPAAAAATGRFAWPTYGPLTQYFSAWHSGLDIAPPYGTPIYAADAGTVVNIQYLTWGYGWHIYIDHGNGYTTLYGHTSRIYVVVGQKVAKGQLIANVGATGYATGPHLHFEIRYLGVAQNPLKFLP
jgi:murein DD-endopeptidase MepM/ murein hydrolase activator NlpD